METGTNLKGFLQHYLVEGSEAAHWPRFLCHSRNYPLISAIWKFAYLWDGVTCPVQLVDISMSSCFCGFFFWNWLHIQYSVTMPYIWIECMKSEVFIWFQFCTSRIHNTTGTLLFIPLFMIGYSHVRLTKHFPSYHQDIGGVVTYLFLPMRVKIPSHLVGPFLPKRQHTFSTSHFQVPISSAYLLYLFFRMEITPVRDYSCPHREGTSQHVIITHCQTALYAKANKNAFGQ